MPLDRFFISDPPEHGLARLAPEEAHHLRRVRRIRLGDEVVLFDGSGTDYIGRVSAFEHGCAVVAVAGATRNQREPEVHVTLAVALVGLRAMDQLVDACTQLGLSRLVPIRTARTASSASAGRLARWRRIALEACKQCGRAIIPAVDSPVGFAHLLTGAKDYDLSLIASTAAEAPPLLAAIRSRPRSILCLIGPEGGFADEEELSAADAGCVPVSLAKTILRTETAAATALALLLHAAETRAGGVTILHEFMNS